MNSIAGCAFITFGCWGKRTVDGEGPILKVFDTLETYLLDKSKEVDFIMVTGDVIITQKENIIKQT